MRKKSIGLIFAVLVMIGMIIAPAAAQDAMMGIELACPEGEGEIAIAAGAVGAEREQALEAVSRLEEMCPDMGITIEVLEMPDSATERLNQYLQTWEQESPDIDVFQVDVIWPAIIAPHVVDMNEYLPEGYVDVFNEVLVANQTVDGSLVAIPWFLDAAGMYYRTDLLEEYGVEVPTTWAELEVAAQAVQDAHRAVTGNEDFWGYVWQGNDYEGLTCDAHEWLVSTTGETFISPDGEVNVTDEAFLAALDMATGWVGSISPEGVTTYQEEESRAVWQAGNAAFMRNWPYAFNLGNAEDSAVAGMFEWVPLPQGDAGRAGACLGGWQLAVSQYSDNVEAAAAVAAFLASPGEQKIRALSAQGNAPTIPGVYEEPELQEDVLMSRFGPIANTAYPRPSTVTGAEYNQASALFSAAVHSVLTGSASAADAMAELEVALQDMLDSME